ncbi:MAG TPA: (2Fe-2S)-binding protein [Candidatus Acidoferrales bacterium]|jgi:aerobic-type carbon monoxide dehydrogenase small subunit (CoxS/CutS family)|nr:(2Fe-2S)-binding protein [Candidatus Acidoferrales bacterium]
MPQTITVNGQRHVVESTPDTPLLYVLRDELALDGPMFGCGLSQCGACAVLIDKKEVRSCVTPVGTVGDRRITTIEGLPQLWKQGAKLHPIQQAWIDEQAPQCGYCQSGMMIAAVSLLERTPHPNESQIKQGMNGHLCRCGTQPRIVKAVARAARSMA